MRLCLCLHSCPCLSKHLLLSLLLFVPCWLCQTRSFFIVCSPPADDPSSTASVWTVCLRLLLLAPHSILSVPRFPFASANPRRHSLLWGNATQTLLTNRHTCKTLPFKPPLIHNSLTFSTSSCELRRSFCFSRYRCTAPCFFPRGPGGDPLSPPVPPSLLSTTPTITPCNSWAWATCTADPHRQVLGLLARHSRDLRSAWALSFLTCHFQISG